MIESTCKYFTGIKRRKGQGMTEYIIIVGLIALSAIVIVALFGKQIKAQFSAMTGAMSGESSEVASYKDSADTEEATSGELSDYDSSSEAQAAGE